MLAYQITDILHPAALINQLGTTATIVIALLVFAENGLLAGFFLPGDSLLVLAGLYSTSKAGGPNQHTHLNIAIIIPVIVIASIIGGEVGFQIGKVGGPKLFHREDSRLFKKEYVQRTRYYLETYGESKAVFLTRFMPIVRPFMNSAVGMVEMPRRKFTAVNILASVAWGVGLPLIGYTVGSSVHHIDRYIPWITLAIIVFTGLPVMNELRKARKIPAHTES